MKHIDSGSGVPIVWIHGFPLSSGVFQEQLAIGGVRHIVPELPGFGGAAPDVIGSLDDYADRCIALLDAKRIERAVFAGVSMGGYICFSIARRYPERLLALILIDTKETADTAEAKKGRAESIAKVTTLGTAPVVDSMLPKMLTASAPADLKRRVKEIMESATPEAVIAALGAMAQRPDSSELLASLDVPVLIVVGEEDAITPPADSERMAHSLSDGELVRIPGAAHLSQMEQPAAFNAAVEAFLAEHFEE